MNTKKDEIFNTAETWGPGQFVFDKRVADVFDDMVERSVPGYLTIQLLCADIALSMRKGGPIYDLGCSTGTTLQHIWQRYESGSQKTQKKSDSLTLVGIDRSSEMISKAQEKQNSSRPIHFLRRDLMKDELFSFGSPHVVLLCLVLQFLRPLDRLPLLKKIFSEMKKEGCLLLVEKTVQSDRELNKFFIDYYHGYKHEMGYSEMEISQKREALENVLIPFTDEENRRLLHEAGFSKITTFFQWMNFSGYLAVKS